MLPSQLHAQSAKLLGDLAALHSGPPEAGTMTPRPGIGSGADSTHLPSASSHQRPEGCFQLPSNCGPVLVPANISAIPWATTTTSPMKSEPPLWRGAPSQLILLWIYSPSALGTLYEESVIIPKFHMRNQGSKESRALPEVTQPVGREG